MPCILFLAPADQAHSLSHLSCLEALHIYSKLRCNLTDSRHLYFITTPTLA